MVAAQKKIEAQTGWALNRWCCERVGFFIMCVEVVFPIPAHYIILPIPAHYTILPIPAYPDDP